MQVKNQQHFLYNLLIMFMLKINNKMYKISINQCKMLKNKKQNKKIKHNNQYKLLEKHR